MIAEGEDGWEEMLPEGISNLIKTKELFGYSKDKLVTIDEKKSALCAFLFNICSEELLFPLSIISSIIPLALIINVVL